MDGGGVADRAPQAENSTVAKAAAATSKWVVGLLGRASIVRSEYGLRNYIQCQKQHHAIHESMAFNFASRSVGRLIKSRSPFEYSPSCHPVRLTRIIHSKDITPTMHLYGRAKMAIRSAIRPIRRRAIVKAIGQILLLVGAFVLGIACDGWSLRAWVGDPYFSIPQIKLTPCGRTSLSQPPETPSVAPVNSDEPPSQPLPDHGSHHQKTTPTAPPTRRTPSSTTSTATTRAARCPH